MKIDTLRPVGHDDVRNVLAEEPRSQGWFQIDAFGQPIMIEYGYQQSFRYLPCFSNQDYLDYLKKIVRYAVTEVKTDFIHFDNFSLSAEPYSCHCRACKTGFRGYLRKKYTAEQRKERFGFENIDYVNPPRWNSDNRPEKLQIIVDPSLSRVDRLSMPDHGDALSQMAELVRVSKSRCRSSRLIMAAWWAATSPWFRGTYHARLVTADTGFLG